MRATSKKRPPLMTTQRWIFAIVALLLIGITVFGSFYRDIQRQNWSDEDQAKAKAMEAANLKSIETVYKHVWNKESWIVEGIDQEDDDVYVFMTEDEQPLTILAAESKSLKAIEASFTTEKQGAEVKRIQPGLLDGKPVWEVYYKLGGEAGHFYYEFYTFDSGTFVNVYKLPAKTEP